MTKVIEQRAIGRGGRSAVMKSIISRVGLLAAVCVLGAAGSAAAGTIEVKVPFEFQIHGQTMPAGEYRFENDGSVLMIRGEHGNKPTMFVFATPAGGHDPAGTEPALSFTRVEKQYKLTGVWESSSEGFQVSR